MDTELPRGVRNNNPCNIEIEPGTNWLGLIGADGPFAVFVKPEDGIRAAAKIFHNFQVLHGVSTILEAINRWAPSKAGNDTDAYVKDVCERLGVGPTDPVNFATLMPQLIPAIIAHESANYVYPPEIIATGIAAAGLT